MSKKTVIPKTVEEAIEFLDKELNKEDKEFLIEHGAVSVHHSLGRWIRNNWGLWTSSELKGLLMEKGYSEPDEMSNYIIEEYIKHLKNRLSS